jgi:hypothetical protein
MDGFWWTGARGVRLRLWSVATVVREAGVQGSDGECGAARQKSGDDEGSAARQKSSYGEGNASMHGKYFEASDVHIFFLFFCNLQMFVYIAWIYQI